MQQNKICLNRSNVNQTRDLGINIVITVIYNGNQRRVFLLVDLWPVQYGQSLFEPHDYQLGAVVSKVKICFIGSRACQPQRT